VSAEYSRDLSAKCFRAQKHLAELGFRVGGTSGYGLRRMAISTDGCRAQLLCSGEYKSIVSDHVKLVPGPNEEVEVVRNIFSMALAGSSYRTIAAELNR
jgi:Recombinase